MEQRFTPVYHEIIPETVGSTRFSVSLSAPIPDGYTPQKVLDDFVAEMHPPRGTVSVGSIVGGQYRGHVYEICVRDAEYSVWAHDEGIARKILEILASDEPDRSYWNESQKI